MSRKETTTVRVHVNQHVIRANQKHGTDDPVFTVKHGRHNDKARSVEITGRSRLVYSPDKPLSCGAKVWIQCEAIVGIGVGEGVGIILPHRTGGAHKQKTHDLIRLACESYKEG